MTPAARAAQVLREYAQLIFESEVDRSGEFKGRIRNPEYRAEIEEYRHLADELDKFERPSGYALVMPDGAFVGIWRDQESAEIVRRRSRMAESERIRPVAFLDGESQ